jgi:hypothetical protein
MSYDRHLKAFIIHHNQLLIQNFIVSVACPLHIQNAPGSSMVSEKYFGDSVSYNKVGIPLNEPGFVPQYFQFVIH